MPGKRMGDCEKSVVGLLLRPFGPFLSSRVAIIPLRWCGSSLALVKVVTKRGEEKEDLGATVGEGRFSVPAPEEIRALFRLAVAAPGSGPS